MQKFPSMYRFLIIVFIFINVGNITESNTNIQKSNPQFENSPYSNQTKDPIKINGNSQLVDFVRMEGLRGEGTSISPYIIENYVIQIGEDSGIWIENTDLQFIIQNCTIVGEYDIAIGMQLNSLSLGITFGNVISGTVRNCTIKSCFAGISLSDSEYNHINSNFINSTRGAIRIQDSNNNEISHNFASYGNFGIYLHTSNNNSIRYNSANNYSAGGIYLQDSSNSTISHNFVSDNSIGIELYRYSCNNIVTQNFVTDNYVGIQPCYSSNSNLFFFNDIYSNGAQVRILNISINNRWDNGTSGNFWGKKYDQPYRIYGQGDNVDYHPLESPVYPDRFPNTNSGDTSSTSSTNSTNNLLASDSFWLISFACLIIISGVTIYIKKQQIPKKKAHLEVDDNTKPKTTNTFFPEENDEPPAEINEEPPAEINEEPPAEINEEPPAEINEEPPAEINEEPPAEINEEPPAEINEELPAEINEEPPAEINEELPAEINEEPPTEINEEPLTEINEEPPVEIFVETPNPRSNELIFYEETILLSNNQSPTIHSEKNSIDLSSVIVCLNCGVDIPAHLHECPECGKKK
ncbi:NosD domain-containing protein [Candidatus Lokiarchaeum ossiferum]|uniref:NosD domain-containing protein n=1 Tax=Candidatus Lokiarchaeum ossiferum TaxID=2951803 RepID=UPI00352CACB6